MQTARSRDTDLVHNIELFSLLAPDVREQHKPLECEECGHEAYYVKESVDGRGAHFRATHGDRCKRLSNVGASRTEGQVSWRDDDEPAILDLDAPAVILGAPEHTPAAPTKRHARKGETRGESAPDASGPKAKRPTLATLLKFAERGALASYPSFRVRLTEAEEIDVSATLRPLDDITTSDVGIRIVAFGAIMAASRSANGDLWLVWRKEQPFKILIPSDLVSGPLAEGWPLVSKLSERPKLLLIGTVRETRHGKHLLRAERGLFVIDYRPYQLRRAG